MKANEVRKGRMYKMKVKGSTFIGIVKEVITNSSGNTFEVEDGVTHRLHTIRSLSAFVDEFVRPPKVGEYVRIAVGLDKDSLAADMVYLVKGVNPTEATIACGQKLLIVPLDSLRVVDGAQHHQCTCIVAEAYPKGNQTICKYCGGEVSAAQIPKAEPKGPEWYEAAFRAGFSADNPPPSDWYPGKPLAKRPEPLPKPTFGPKRNVLEWSVQLSTGKTMLVAASTQAEAERLAREDGHSIIPFDLPKQVLSNPSSQKSAGGFGAKLKAVAAQKATQVEDDAPHVICEALAGTGKTTTLVEGLKELMCEGSSTVQPSPQQRKVWDALCLSRGKVKSVCFCAFNTSIADELKRRVPRGVDAMTMHSMGYRTVMNTYGDVRVDQWRAGELVCEVMGKDFREVKRDPQSFTVLTLVEKIVELSKMTLTDVQSAEDLDKLVTHFDVELLHHKQKVYDLVPQVMAKCLDVGRDMRVDYNDMVWLPVALDLPMTRYDLLLVDEAQDLNRCQHAIARKAGKRLVFCGDRNQAIYGFAGADSKSLDNLFIELSDNSKGSPTCIKLPLTVTRRCGKAIVEEARKIVPDFEWLEANGPGKVSHAPYTEKSANPSGNYWTGGEGAKAETVKVPPEQTYLPMVRDGDFIICRTNAPLVTQCFLLLKRGVKATIQGREIGKGLIDLVTSLDASSVPDLVGKMSDWHHKEVEKEQAKRQPVESRIINLNDKYECLLSFTEGRNTVDEVVARIKSIFVDSRDKTGVRLSSIHKAKGLEAKRVFFLVPDSAPCPHFCAKSAWQIEQEYNLKYVGITRVIEELIWVK